MCNASVAMPGMRALPVRNVYTYREIYTILYYCDYSSYVISGCINPPACCVAPPKHTSNSIPIYTVLVNFTRATARYCSQNWSFRLCSNLHRSAWWQCFIVFTRRQRRQLFAATRFDNIIYTQQQQLHHTYAQTMLTTTTTSDDYITQTRPDVPQRQGVNIYTNESKKHKTSSRSRDCIAAVAAAAAAAAVSARWTLAAQQAACACAAC